MVKIALFGIAAASLFMLSSSGLRAHDGMHMPTAETTRPLTMTHQQQIEIQLAQPPPESRMALLGELLLVLDYLDMALGSPVTTDEGRNLLFGVQMTRDQLAGLLEREGAAPVDSSGDFDPQVHQAVAIVETDEVPPGRIVETVRHGWTIGEHVLRHAHVKVAEAPGTGAQAAADAVEGSEAPAEDEDA